MPVGMEMLSPLTRLGSGRFRWGRGLVAMRADSRSLAALVMTILWFGHVWPGSRDASAGCVDEEAEGCHMQELLAA